MEESQSWYRGPACVLRRQYIQIFPKYVAFVPQVSNALGDRAPCLRDNVSLWTSNSVGLGIILFQTRGYIVRSSFAFRDSN